jgi:hypothetical protein
MSAMTPGRLGTDARSSWTSAPSRPASRSARRSPAAASFQRVTASASRAAALADLGQAGDGLIDLLGQRVAVGQVDVGPDRAVGPAHRVASRNEGRSAGRSSPPSACGRLGDEHVGQDVREVRDAGHEPVVGLGVDRPGPPAERGDRAVQALEQDPARPRGRREVPDGPLEQVGAGVLHAGGLGARERMAAAEALVVEHDRALGRADVGDRAVARCGGEHRVEDPSQRADGHRDDGELGVGHRPGQRAGGHVDRPALPRALERRGVGVPAGHGRAQPLPCGEPHGPADQPHPDDRDPHCASGGRGGEALAGEVGGALDLVGVRGERVGDELLRAVADGLVGVGVRLDDDPVGARRGRGEAERLDERPPARPRGSGRRPPAGGSSP